MARKTMTSTPTVENVYTVQSKTGSTLLETRDFQEACVVRRAGKDRKLVTVAYDVSPARPA